MAYYRAYGSRDPREAGLRLKHLDRHFHGQKLLDIDSAVITAYVVRRKAQGAANGTINIELATLRKALKVAQEHGKLGKVPAIKMLKPAAPREGFFERAQFEAGNCSTRVE
jgi:site-specific recombinase XerC